MNNNCTCMHMQLFILTCRCAAKTSKRRKWNFFFLWGETSTHSGSHMHAQAKAHTHTHTHAGKLLRKTNDHLLHWRPPPDMSVSPPPIVLTNLCWSDLRQTAICNMSHQSWKSLHNYLSRSRSLFCSIFSKGETRQTSYFISPCRCML